MKNLFGKSLAAVAAVALSVVSCDAPDPAPDIAPEWVVITFEAVPAELLAGPTSYGENLYEGFADTDEVHKFSSLEYGNLLTFGINTASDGSVNFWNGGLVVSEWNIMSDPEDAPYKGWWCSYENQCSVYNAESFYGANRGAGCDGSDRFGVINSSWTDGDEEGVELRLLRGEERIFDHLYVCNTAYAYGNMLYGNDFAESLDAQQGWFDVVVEGYRRGALEPVARDTLLLADFRDNNREIVDRWTKFELENIRKQSVERLVFTFDGSDVGEWGLNTPKYVCIDNICVSYATYKEQY